MNVTRDVIRDLWSLCEAGEGSEDSRRFVEAFLAQDEGFARTLHAGRERLHLDTPALPANHEAQTLTRMRKRLERKSPLRLLAAAFTGLAIVRLFQQTEFTTSPNEVIGLSICAVILWFAYGWHTRRLQRAAVFTKPSRQ